MSESSIINFDELCAEYKPIRVSYKGKDYTIDAFDGALIQRMDKAAKECAKDSKKTAHDSMAAQLNAVLGIPLEDLFKEDFRALKKLHAKICEAIFKAGESEATSAQ